MGKIMAGNHMRLVSMKESMQAPQNVLRKEREDGSTLDWQTGRSPPTKIIRQGVTRLSLQKNVGYEQPFSTFSTEYVLLRHNGW